MTTAGPEQDWYWYCGGCGRKYGSTAGLHCDTGNTYCPVCGCALKRKAYDPARGT